VSNGSIAGPILAVYSYLCPEFQRLDVCSTKGYLIHMPLETTAEIKFSVTNIDGK
jgi:hypothetical protein